MANYLIDNGFNYDGTTSGNEIAKSMASTTLWTSSSVTGAVGNTDFPTKRNTSSFTAVPGGYRTDAGLFNIVGAFSYFWLSTEFNTTDAWMFSLRYDNVNVTKTYVTKKLGFSIRCIKD